MSNDLNCNVTESPEQNTPSAAAHRTNAKRPIEYAMLYGAGVRRLSDLLACKPDCNETPYPMPSVSTQAYEKLSELPMLDGLVHRTWARNLNTPFDRLLLLQAGRVAKAYDSQQKVVKAMAILGMLKAALGRDRLLAEDRVEADKYLAKLGAEGI